MRRLLSGRGRFPGDGTGLLGRNATLVGGGVGYAEGGACCLRPSRCVGMNGELMCCSLTLLMRVLGLACGYGCGCGSEGVGGGYNGLGMLPRDPNQSSRISRFGDGVGDGRGGGTLAI